MNRILFGLLTGTAALGSPAPLLADKTLATRLQPLADAHQGKTALAVRHLETGEAYSLRADAPMPTASLVKFPVMIEAYRQAAEKKIALDAPVVLKKEDKVPGAGILTTHFSPGASFPLRDAVHLMIVYSDNTATNLVLDAIGIDATAKTMETMGFPNTKIHSKVFKRETSKFPERSKQFGLGSTTADEMVKLFELLHHGKLVSPVACKEMHAHLLQCDDSDKFPRFLPAGTKVAFKTGSVDAARTAAGILYTKKGPVALCVLTAENQDKRWVKDNAGDLLCAKVAQEVWKHFGGE
jgi:beta-lactamase class A